MTARLDEFVRERGERWSELDELVARAGRHPERLPPADVLRLGETYRSTAADLAIARRRFRGDPLVGTLEQRVTRARTVVYDGSGTRTSFAAYVKHGYWHRVIERPGLLAVSAGLLLLPALAAGVWGWLDSGSALGLVGSGYDGVTQPRSPGTDLGLSADQQAAAAGAIFTNNIRVAIMAFAGGITFGVVTAAVLLFNGLLLGAVTGLAIASGNGEAFIELVSPHGVLELSCIVVSGAAGLRMGWALIDPGTETRGTALRREARAAVEMLLGTAAVLVIAGLVEGFVTPSGVGLPAALAVGFSLGALYWFLVLYLGRRSPTT